MVPHVPQLFGSVSSLLHLPAQHSSLAPQEVPLVTGLPVSEQTGTPVEHTVVPMSHGLAGVQTAPSVHALHAPLSQTSLVPHVVPLAASLPLSLQTGTPVVHDVVPVWQLLAGVHAAPTVHGVQVPLSQTSFVPHEVPFATSVPVLLHVETPVEHEVDPT